MKTGEYYRSKWNHYKAKIVTIDTNHVKMRTNDGVNEYYRIENFNANWEKCRSIYEFEHQIKTKFKNCRIFHYTQLGESFKVIAPDYVWIEFAVSTDNNYLRVWFSQSIQQQLNEDVSVMDFDINDADEVIDLFASLI